MVNLVPDVVGVFLGLRHNRGKQFCGIFGADVENVGGALLDILPFVFGGFRYMGGLSF